VGQPEDPQWRGTVDNAAEVMQEVEQLGASADLFTEEKLHHRRGEFLAIPAGVSFGGGQTVRTQPKLLNAFLPLIDELHSAGTGKPCPQQGDAPTYSTHTSVPKRQAYSRLSVQYGFTGTIFHPC
jgi:hypothetical protein